VVYSRAVGNRCSRATGVSSGCIPRRDDIASMRCETCVASISPSGAIWSDLSPGHSLFTDPRRWRTDRLVDPERNQAGSAAGLHGDGTAVTLGESLLRVIPGHEVEPVVGSVRTILECDPQPGFGFVNGGRRAAGATPVAADAGGENAADQDGCGDQHRLGGQFAFALGMTRQARPGCGAGPVLSIAALCYGW
jgi:hypothetical protein